MKMSELTNLSHLLLHAIDGNRVSERAGDVVGAKGVGSLLRELWTEGNVTSGYQMNFSLFVITLTESLCLFMQPYFLILGGYNLSYIVYDALFYFRCIYLDPGCSSRCCTEKILFERHRLSYLFNCNVITHSCHLSCQFNAIKLRK